MRALNSDTLAPELIAHIETDEEDEQAYTVTRPKREPFFAKCAIWHHKTDNYIVWMYKGSGTSSILSPMMISRKSAKWSTHSSPP